MKKRIVILSALMALTALLAVGCTRTDDKAGTNDSAAVQNLLNKIDDTQKMTKQRLQRRMIWSRVRMRLTNRTIKAVILR